MIESIISDAHVCVCKRVPFNCPLDFNYAIAYTVPGGIAHTPRARGEASIRNGEGFVAVFSPLALNLRTPMNPCRRAVYRRCTGLELYSARSKFLPTVCCIYRLTAAKVISFAQPMFIQDDLFFRRMGMTGWKIVAKCGKFRKSC